MVAGKVYMYAIVQTGGKQYRVAPEQQVDVDNLAVPAGERVELGEVLFLQDDNGSHLGSPTLQGAKVLASSMGSVRGEKVTVFKYKNKTRYRRKTGHRSMHTRLSIKQIVGPGG